MRTRFTAARTFAPDHILMQELFKQAWSSKTVFNITGPARWKTHLENGKLVLKVKPKKEIWL